MLASIGPKPSKAREECKLNQRIKRLLGEDRVEQARQAGESMTLLRTKSKEKESWRTAKEWYRQAMERPSKRCHHTMARKTKEREKL